MGSEDMEVDVTEPVEQYQPPGPRPIKQLSNDVINQIAAAEIIHRPSNVIKELIENSLDAGSTSIKLTIKDGGLKLIQITDNGHGIRKDDLPLLCTRYATSKLAKFSDLQSLTTYGFRGEALASVSYCSHVEVLTKTTDSSCGWKAKYENGVLVPIKAGTDAEPKPSAANDGTVISAEDLFYNSALRRKAFRSPSDEYNRILDVVTKYAVHNPSVAWVCKKAGSSLPEVSSPAGSTAKANIGLLYTAALAADLLEVPLTSLKPEDKLGAILRGWVSNANTNWARKGGWLFFINNRLVDSSKIKKAVDSLYTAFLPKGAAPWIYLALDIDPAKIDVNVSPTKSDVHFLNEDEMVEAIVAAVQAALTGANTSRTFSVQTLLPGVADPIEKRSDSSASIIRSKPAPNYKVRMDPANRTLDSMIVPSDPSQLAAFTESQILVDARPTKRRAVIEGQDQPFELDEDDEDNSAGMHGPRWNPEAGASTQKTLLIPESECEFSSILNLRKAVKKRGSAGVPPLNINEDWLNPVSEVTEILQKHAFVGVVDPSLCLALFQHSTKLFLVNHAALADEHFYQLGLRQFGAFSRLKLEPAPSLRDLLRIAAEDEPGIGENALLVDDVVNDIYDLLQEKRDMIDEYFSLRLSESGSIESLPLILRNYTPELDRLPHFLLCLGTQVDWEDEKNCFDSILRELAFFYSPRPFGVSPSAANGDADDSARTAEEVSHQAWQLEHVLFPNFRRYTAWPKDLLGTDIRQVANLPDLFRIFERC